MVDHASGTREPVLLGEIVGQVLEAATSRRAQCTSRPEQDAPRGAARCRDCGAQALWCRTERGRWMLMEPGELRTGAVPPGSRYRVAGDGTAVGLRSAVPDGTCRISHFDVCGAKPAPVGSPALTRVWRRNHEPLH